LWDLRTGQLKTISIYNFDFTKVPVGRPDFGHSLFRNFLNDLGQVTELPSNLCFFMFNEQEQCTHIQQMWESHSFLYGNKAQFLEDYVYMHLGHILSGK
jgi:hypothetical protein